MSRRFQGIAPSSQEVAIVRVVAVLAILAAMVALLVWGWQALDARATIARFAFAAWRWLAASRLVQASRARHPHAWAFLGRRIATAGAFGLHFTLGLLVSLLAMSTFAKIAGDVLERDDLQRLDASFAAFATSIRTPALIDGCTAASFIGAPVTIGAIGTVVAVVLFLRRQRWLALAWSATLLGGGALDWALKMWFRRPRPEGAMAFLYRESWSFPSGHTMGSTIGYGMLAFLLLLFARRRGWTTGSRAMIVVVAALLVLLIGASRVCLGVHYATDVIGALAAGAMWLAASIAGVEAMRRRDPPASDRVSVPRRGTRAESP